jgi:bacterioferritin (cytochrome b1)
VDSIQTDLVKEQRRGNELQATTTDLKSQVDIQENEFMARLKNVQELINDSIEKQLHSFER